MESENWIVHVESVLEPVLPMFIEMRWQDLVKLKKGIELADFESLKKLSHRLLGTPGAFGFDFLVQLAQEMEVAIGQRDLKKLTQIADHYEKFMHGYQLKIE